MNRIPPEIDSLLWSVAESGDDQAINEFGDRYPEHRSELLKRLSMVRQLKGARPTEGPFGPPRFEIAKSTKPMFVWPRWIWVPATALLGVLAYASYTYTLHAMSPPKTIEAIPSGTQRLPVVSSNGPVNKNPIYVPPRNGDEPPIVKDKPKDYVAPINNALALQFERISLHTALDAVGQQSGIRIEIGPGLEDFDISMKYSGLSAMEVLEDMGRNFGFSVFPQGDKAVLIIPEVDKKKQQGGVVEPAVPELPPELGKPNPSKTGANGSSAPVAGTGNN